MTDNSLSKPLMSQRLGMASLILGIVVGLGSCVLTPLSASIALGGGDFGFTVALATICGLQSIVGLLNIIGVVLGIFALVKKTPGKGKAIIGVALNVIFICISTAILWNSIPLLIKILEIH